MCLLSPTRHCRVGRCATPSTATWPRARCVSTSLSRDGSGARVGVHRSGRPTRSPGAPGHLRRGADRSRDRGDGRGRRSPPDVRHQRRAPDPTLRRAVDLDAARPPVEVVAPRSPAPCGTRVRSPDTPRRVRTGTHRPPSPDPRDLIRSSGFTRRLLTDRRHHIDPNPSGLMAPAGPTAGATRWPWPPGARPPSGATATNRPASTRLVWSPALDTAPVRGALPDGARSSPGWRNRAARYALLRRGRGGGG